MATFSSHYAYNSMLFVPTPSSNHPFASSFFRPSNFTVRSSHSNPKILKTNRKSIYGKEIDDEADDEEFADPADLDAKGKRLKSKTVADRQHEKEKGVRSLNNGQSSRLPKRIASLRKNNSAKFGGNSKERRYPKLYEAIVLDENWLPLLDYLSTFGIKESQFLQIYERHMSSFQVDLYSAQERIDYLLSLGVKHTDISQILLRQPQILEYTVENLKTHVAFLMGLGIPSSKLGQIIASTPSIFSYSVENSLKPTVRYLIEEVGIEEKDLVKVIQLSPEILVQRIDISWNTRFMFLTKELGAPKESIVKMVTEHPQLLHYSIDDELLPRINFLRSLGVKNADILEIFTCLTKDVLSLSLEDTLKPKFLYLVNELHNEVISLSKHQLSLYLNMSLEQRIRPRHRFLVSLKKAPIGQPFPLRSLNPTDDVFCQRWAGTTLVKYLLFCQNSKRYLELSEAIVLDVNWLPLLDYLSTFGIKESQFLQIYERHMSSFQVDLYSAQERIDYLLSLGVKHTDVSQILLRQPQILEYTVENLKTHVAFLMGLGVPSSKLGQIIASTPSIFSYSVENSLKPTVRYLIEEVGIKEKDLGKVIQLSPEILVQRIDIKWNTRFMFLTKELGAPKKSIVKMVKEHPQLLHYSIDDELLPRINFLRSIGIKNADILKILAIFTSLTQHMLSPSLEDNLKPKFLYLVNELHNEVISLSKHQLYLYLNMSLEQRIRPRHRFLVSLKKVRRGRPFPLSSLNPTDEVFCRRWAGTTLDIYLKFRTGLLVKKFADEYLIDEELEKNA